MAFGVMLGKIELLLETDGSNGMDLNIGISQSTHEPDTMTPFNTQKQ